MPVATDITTPPLLREGHSYLEVYEQHVTDAAFLWLLRSIAVDQPSNTLTEIIDLDQRLAAELDGLMTVMDLGWQACELALVSGEPGEVFTAMVVAIRSHEAPKIQKALEVGLASARTLDGLISALGWLPSDLVWPWIEKFLNSKDLNHKYLGLAACSVRREDPGAHLTAILQREDCRSHAKLHGRALRLIGELRRQDLMSALEAAAGSPEPTVAFWANWSAILLGNKAMVMNLQPFAFHRGPYQAEAIQLAFRALPIALAREWITKLAADPAQIRAVTQAIGALGDPHAVNWLIAKMANPPLARLAGEAFTSITGVDLDKHQLSRAAPTGQSLIPSGDMSDAYVGIDEDENLPWPDVEKVAGLWRNQGHQFLVGQRYFLGKPITLDHLKHKLSAATQRQRHAAALELALLDVGPPLINTRAR
jgi:uncharacterized protein (TIGR02270 family)